MEGCFHLALWPFGAVPHLHEGLLWLCLPLGYQWAFLRPAQEVEQTGERLEASATGWFSDCWGVQSRGLWAVAEEGTLADRAKPGDLENPLQS